MDSMLYKSLIDDDYDDYDDIMMNDKNNKSKFHMSVCRFFWFGYGLKNFLLLKPTFMVSNTRFSPNS